MFSFTLCVLWVNKYQTTHHFFVSFCMSCAFVLPAVWVCFMDFEMASTIWLCNEWKIMTSQQACLCILTMICENYGVRVRCRDHTRDELGVTLNDDNENIQNLATANIHDTQKQRVCSDLKQIFIKIDVFLVCLAQYWVELFNSPYSLSNLINNLISIYVIAILSRMRHSNKTEKRKPITSTNT